MNKHDYIANLGLLAIASRLKRLSDSYFQECSTFYQEAGVELDPTSFPILHYLHAHPKSSLAHIAQALGITHAAVSQRISKLEKAELIIRHSLVGDKRASLITLSPSGQQHVEQAAPFWEMIRTGLEDCLEEDAEKLMHVLGRCEEAISSGNFEKTLHKKLSTHRANQVDIISYNAENAHLFAEMNAEWLERYFEIEPIDEEVLGKPEEHILDKGGEIWFAKRDDEILGCYALLAHSENAFEFSKFAVRPAAQGQQIGQKLLRHAMQRATERGMKKIILYTHSRLLTACALYRRYGFYDVPDQGATCRYARCDTVMHYDLTNNVEMAA